MNSSTPINKYRVPPTAETINLIAEAMNFTMPAPQQRKMTSDFLGAEEEAKEVSNLYINLKITEVRQALLDILVSLNKAQS